MRGLRLFIRQMRGTLLVLLAVGVVGTVVVLIGHYSAVGTGEPDTFRPGRPQIVSGDGAVTSVSPAVRRSIDRLVKEFVADAVARRHPSAAYALVTPALRAAATPAQWRAGEIPVLPYPADLRRVAPTVSYVYPRRVGLDLVLQPRPGASQGGMAFAMEVKRVGSRWLVDSIAPVQGFGGPSASSKRASRREAPAPVLPEHGNIGVAWLVMAAVVTPLVLILGGVAVLGIRSRFGRTGELPPPPVRRS